MTWKHCTIGIDQDYQRVRDGVGLLAATSGDSPLVALLTRTTADRCRRVLLLSPKAVELAGDILPSHWTDCDGPELFAWDIVIGPPDACEALGLRRPCFGKREPIPVFWVGGQPVPQEDPALFEPRT